MCRRDLYPRSAVRPDIVTRYGEFLHDLPPIEINQRNELIDGWHRLEAHKNAGIETIGAIVTEVASDIDHLMLAVKRNSSHGEQLPIEEEREARRLRMQDAPSWPRQKPAAGGR
jgi:hypothetical protein